MVTKIQSFSFKNGVANATYRNREVRCMLPLTGSYECTLIMVSRGASVFYQAFPVMMENKELRMNNFLIKEQ